MPPSVLPPKAKARAAAEIDAEAERLFKQIDTNKSGTIDADELLKHLLGAGVDTDEISRTFAAIDTDGDGAITKEEWTAGYARYLAADETLDPTKPLRAPHFRHARRVAALVLGPAGDATTAAARRPRSLRSSSTATPRATPPSKRCGTPGPGSLIWSFRKSRISSSLLSHRPHVHFEE